MEKLLFGLERVEILVDDVIVYPVTIDQLINVLGKVFERCRERNLKLNPKIKKVRVWTYRNTLVLSHVVSTKAFNQIRVSRYIRRALTPTEIRYSQIERVALTLVLGGWKNSERSYWYRIYAAH